MTDIGFPPGNGVIALIRVKVIGTGVHILCGLSVIDARDGKDFQDQVPPQIVASFT